MQQRIPTALYWSIPPLLCLILYWPGPRAWFQDDDFAFLGLLPNIHNWGDLSHALFQPTVGGSWRPLSDRGYFLSLEALFGINPLPFHVVSFLTQFVNLALISMITRKLTGSMVAGFLAPILWITNSKLIVVMAWCSAYDYPMCGCFLLAAFWFFLRWIETGRRRYGAGMWAVFLLGFGALETNIVFPLLAATYTLLCARSNFRKTLPLFIPSIVFVAADMSLVHRQAAGPYKMHLTTGMIKTFAHYWAWTFEPVNLAVFTHLPAIVGVIGMVLFSTALLGFAIHQAYRRNLVPVFFVSWFVIVILPVLPFRDNVQDLYLALPAIGLSMLGACAFAWAWAKPSHRRVATVLLAFFLVESIPTARGGTEWYYRRSREVEALVHGVVAKHALNPDKTILLTGIGSPLFSASISQHPFYAFGIQNVFLAPGSEAEIAADNPAAVPEFVLPAAKAADVMAHGAAMVLESQEGKVTDVTGNYHLPLAARAVTGDRRVDVGDPRYQQQLGPEWYAIDRGFRWMPKRASIHFPGPLTSGQKLVVSGYCPAMQIAAGPLRMVLSVDGVPLPAVTIDKGDVPFSFEFVLQENRRQQIEIEVEVERTFSTAEDRRSLGLAFGVFEIR